MPINRKETRLKPLPLRITPRQFERLVALRARDSLAIQEHVRRAIDIYLDNQERKIAREEQTGDPLAQTGTDAVSLNQQRQPQPPVAPPDRQRVGSRPYNFR